MTAKLSDSGCQYIVTSSRQQCIESDNSIPMYHPSLVVVAINYVFGILSSLLTLPSIPAVNIDAVLSISPSSLSPVADTLILICVVGGVAKLLLLLMLLLPLQLRNHSPLSVRSPLSYLIVVEPHSSQLNIFENDVHR